jgi:hypothetical protein
MLTSIWKVTGREGPQHSLDNKLTGGGEVVSVRSTGRPLTRGIFLVLLLLWVESTPGS